MRSRDKDTFHDILRPSQREEARVSLGSSLRGERKMKSVS